MTKAEVNEGLQKMREKKWKILQKNYILEAA